MNFISELKRRNVIRIAGLYLVGAWLLSQISETISFFFDVPYWFLQSLSIALVVGFIIVITFTWFYEFGPYYLRRDASNISKQRPLAAEVIYNIERTIVLLFVITLAFFCFNMFMFKEKLQDADLLANNAVVKLPSDAKTLQDSAIEQRRLGRFDEALKAFDAAIKINPRDDSLVYDRALTAFFARRLQEAEDGFLRAQGLNPNNTNASIKLAELKYFSSGDAGKALALVRGEQAEVLLYQIELLTANRKYDEALALIPKYQSSSPAAASQTPMVKGILLARAGRQEAALPLLISARTKLSKDLASVPVYSVEAQIYKHKLAMVEAYIGNERVARELTLEALALMPPEKDATIGVIGISQAAHMYAVLDRADLVVEMLARLRTLSGTDLRTSAASLRADPIWDKINDDQRFQDEIILFEKLDNQ